MLKKSNWLHLRIPFSYFLLPVFLFGISVGPNLSETGLLWIFVILHLLIYPASNGYNSYFDKDEKSIGGLRNPPPVDKGLFHLAFVFDTLAFVQAAFLLNWQFTVMIIIYSLVSRAYSHPSIRLKKYAWLSWFIAGFFQGAWVVGAVFLGLNDFSFSHLLKPHVAYPALLASALLWGSYPMTQVYQHEEDAKRGDHTLSLRLGIKGTFLFTGLCFAVASGLFYLYFVNYAEARYGLVFLGAMSPVVVYFGWWFLRVLKDESAADFTSTMRLNFLSATCLGGFFLYYFLNSTNILSVAGQY
jgi:1,4-dihydroxy-2-naphthoate octaprenyltransferase